MHAAASNSPLQQSRAPRALGPKLPAERTKLRAVAGPVASSATCGEHRATSADGELVARLLLKQGAAWREFQARYDALLMHVIQRVTRRFGAFRGSLDAEEIKAALMCSLLERDMHKLRSFEPGRGTRLSAWLGVLAKHHAWDHVRAQAKRPPTQDLRQADATVHTGRDPLQVLETKERCLQLQQLLPGLSRKDQRFVELFFLLGQSPEQVARAMRITVSTVYSKKHKIRARLARTDHHPAPGGSECRAS